MPGHDPLERLGLHLERVGLADLLCSYTPAAQTSALTDSVIPPGLLPLVELFCLGREVPEADLDPVIVPALEDLTTAGFATRSGPRPTWSIRDLGLQRVHGLWLLTGRPSAQRTLYFGADSLALAERIPLVGGSALDLCSGPGFQSLWLAARGMRVTGCEIDERAVLLSGVNTRLNGVADRVHLLRSDLCAELPEGSFDVVVANPPMVAVPAGIPYPFVGDGGPDGFGVILRIIEELPGRLAPRGAAYTLGVAAAGDELPLALGALRSEARRLGLRIRLTVTSEHDAGSGSTWDRAIAATSLSFEGSAVTQSSLEERTSKVVQGYADLGVHRVVFFFMTVAEEQHGSVGVLDVRSEHPQNHQGWYVA